MTRIRPHYRNDEFYGFVIQAFNQHEQQYEACGRPFKQYKHAVMALRMVEA